MTDIEFRERPIHEPGSVEISFVIHGEAETLERDTRWGDHAHPVHELLWNEYGANTVRVGHRVWTVTSSMGLWIPAGTVHSGTAPRGVRYRATYFAPSAMTPLSDQPATVGMTPLLRRLLDYVDQEELGRAERANAEAVIFDILAPSQHEILLCMPSDPLIAPIAATVLADPAAGGSLAGWARDLGVSARTVARAFQNDTGLNFSQWLAMARAQHAISLLTRGDPVDEVASQVGYATASAFGAAFRRVTGLTPGVFRDRHLSLSR